MDWTMAAVCGIFFTATFVRSAFGFGQALVAVPLASLFLPVDVVTPVAVLVSITIAAVVVVQDWQKVYFGTASKLVLYTFIGTPAGLLLLLVVPDSVAKGFLAVLIVTFGLYSLARPPASVLRDDKWAWLFGLSAGMLGGAYGMNGPPLVVYGALKGWSPQHFRATLHGYFLPASTISMIGYRLTGLWTPAVTYYYSVALLPVLLAVFAGRWVNQRMQGPAFLRYVHVGLIVIGMTLLLNVLSPAGVTP